MPKRPARSRNVKSSRPEAALRPAIRQATLSAQRRIGARLRSLREAAELTQEKAAEAMAVHEVQLRRMEAGRVNLTLRTMVAASLAYGVPLARLLADSGSGRSRRR